MRILYRLDRFSEDLDFSLIEPEKDFDITKYLSAVQSELEFRGFETVLQKKNEKAVDSAFIKANTLIHLLKIRGDLKTQTGHILPTETLNKERLIEFLTEKTGQVDFERAKNDVEPFLKETVQKDELRLWSNHFFSDYLVHRIRVQEGS